MAEREGEQGAGTESGPERSGIEAAARLGADLAAHGGGSEGGAAGREALDAEVIGPRHTDLYLERFRRFDARGGAYALTWHWPCAFIPLLWLLYRKMYAWAAVLLLAELALGPLAAATPGLSLPFSLAVLIGVPASAHWLYYRHVRRVIARAAEMAASEAERAAFRRGAGGVSLLGPGIVLAVTAAAVLAAVSSGGPVP